MPNLYKIQKRDSTESEWVDMKPMKGWFNTIDLSYNEARGIVSEYNGISKTKNYRTIKQGKNDTIMPCTICNKSIKVNEASGSCDGGITHSHDDCRRNMYWQQEKELTAASECITITSSTENDLENDMIPRPNRSAVLSDEEKSRLKAMMTKNSNVVFVDFKKGK